MIQHELNKQGISLRKYTVGSHKATCPKCSHTRDNKRDQCLSIKIDYEGGAVWKCHHCEWVGNIAGNGYRNKPSGAVKHRKPPIATPLCKQEGESDAFYAWFQKRGISKKTVDDFGITRVTKKFNGEDSPCIAFPYFFNNEVVNYKYRTNDKRFQQEKDARRTLFNYDRAVTGEYFKEKSRLIFVEGEMDVLACHEAGIYNAVSLPDGAPQQARFKDDDKRFTALSDLPDFDEVVIAVDMDEAGQALATELEHRFGKHKCSRVTWPTANDVKCKDANECLVQHGADVLGECFEHRKHSPVDGLYRVSDYLGQVLDIFDGRVQQPLDTGWKDLDKIYRVMPSTFALVTGIPNHGKSNWLDQLIVNMHKNHGWRFAIFSPEHGVASHVRRLSEKMLAMPFEAGPSISMERKQLEAVLAKMEKHFFFVESQDALPNIDWILARARVAVRRHGVKGVVIDPYNMIDSARDGNKREDEHIRDLISKCKAFCRAHDVAMWMVAHPNKLRKEPSEMVYQPPSLYDVSGSAHWFNMCDVGLVVHRDFQTETTRVITRKIREQGVYGEIGEAFFEYDVTKKVYRSC